METYSKMFWVSWQRLYPLYKKIYPSMNIDFYTSSINNSLHNKKEARIMISGSADEDTLQVVISAIQGLPCRSRIVLVDFCEEAINRNRRFAQEKGYDVDIVNADILGYPEKEKFDIIITDGFLDFFSHDGKKAVLQKWHNLLNKGGAAITTIPVNDGIAKKGHDIKGYITIASRSVKAGQNPLENMMHYQRMKQLRAALREKEGKNTPFSNSEEFKGMAEMAGFKLSKFEFFYRYTNPPWLWYNTLLKK